MSHAKGNKLVRLASTRATGPSPTSITHWQAVLHLDSWDLYLRHSFFLSTAIFARCKVEACMLLEFLQATSPKSTPSIRWTCCSGNGRTLGCRAQMLILWKTVSKVKVLCMSFATIRGGGSHSLYLLPRQSIMPFSCKNSHLYLPIIQQTWMKRQRSPWPASTWYPQRCAQRSFFLLRELSGTKATVLHDARLYVLPGASSQHPAANSNMTCGDGDKLKKIKRNGRLHIFTARLYGVNGVGGTCQATTLIWSLAATKSSHWLRLGVPTRTTGAHQLDLSRLTDV